jgi:formylmethanofuran dehydrogenase subunit E
VNNAEVWAKIKSGEIKGFSVEGVFEYKKKEFTIDENIKCSNCNHSWNTSDSKEADKYVCHNCGFDNTAKEMYYQIQKLLQELDS